MPAQTEKKFLEENGVEYSVISYEAAYTAQEIAGAAHIPGHEVAKTVIVKLDGEMAMAVLQATRKVDLDRLRDASGAERVELASESEFKERFPECETGAMPPFGNLYEMDVYADQTLAEDSEIEFNAGTHTELFKLGYADFERLAAPRVVRLPTGSSR